MAQDPNSVVSCPNRKFYLLNIFLHGNNISLSFQHPHFWHSPTAKAPTNTPSRNRMMRKRFFIALLLLCPVPPQPKQLVRLLDGGRYFIAVWGCPPAVGVILNPPPVATTPQSNHPDNYFMGKKRLLGISVAFVIKIIIDHNRSAAAGKERRGTLKGVIGHVAESYFKVSRANQGNNKSNSATQKSQ